MKFLIWLSIFYLFPFYLYSTVNSFLNIYESDFKDFQDILLIESPFGDSYIAYLNEKKVYFKKFSSSEKRYVEFSPDLGYHSFESIEQIRRVNISEKRDSLFLIVREFGSYYLCIMNFNINGDLFLEENSFLKLSSNEQSFHILYSDSSIVKIIYSGISGIFINNLVIEDEHFNYSNLERLPIKGVINSLFSDLDFSEKDELLINTIIVTENGLLMMQIDGENIKSESIITDCPGIIAEPILINDRKFYHLIYNNRDTILEADFINFIFTIKNGYEITSTSLLNYGNSLILFKDNFFRLYTRNPDLLLIDSSETEEGFIFDNHYIFKKDFIQLGDKNFYYSLQFNRFLYSEEPPKSSSLKLFYKVDGKYFIADGEEL